MVTRRAGAGPRCGTGCAIGTLPVGWAGPRAGQLVFHALLPFAAGRIPHDLWIESFTPPFSTSFLPLFSPARVVGFAQNLCGQEMWRTVPAPLFPDRAARPALLPGHRGAQPRRRRADPPVQPGGRRAGHPEWHPDSGPWTSGYSAAVSTSCTWAASTSGKRGWTCCSPRTSGAGWPALADRGRRYGARSGSSKRSGRCCGGMSAGSATSPGGERGPAQRSAFVVLPSAVRHSAWPRWRAWRTASQWCISICPPWAGWMVMCASPPSTSARSLARCATWPVTTQPGASWGGWRTRPLSGRGWTRWRDRHLALVRELLSAPATRTRRRAGVPCREHAHRRDRAAGSARGAVPAPR